MYDPTVGRFLSEDPIAADINLYRYVGNNPLNATDPDGLKTCTITIYGGHNFEIGGMIDKDYPKGDKAAWPIPKGECVAGVGCGSGVDVDGDGKPDSIQDYLEKRYPCNSIYAPRLCKIDDPLEGMKPTMACTFMKYAVEQAKKAARRMLEGKSPNPSKGDCPSECDSVDIVIKCDKAMEDLLKDGIWDGKKVDKKYTVGCQGLCGKTINIPAK